jgi:hypothetical protein
MGLISSQIRKRGNQKLAAPLSTTTLLSPNEVLAAVQGVIEQHNHSITVDNARQAVEGNRLTRFLADKADVSLNQYHWAPRGQDMLISYQRRPAWILEAQRRKKRPDLLDGYWLARLRVFRHDDPETPGIRLEIRLDQWVINRDSGRLHNQDKYEELVERVWEATSADSDRRVPGAAEARTVHEGQISLDLDE